MFNTIMVAYDESQEAALALASAIELAKLLGAHLKIVTVVEALPAFYNIAAIVSPPVVDESLEGKRNQLKTLQPKRCKESDSGRR